MQMAALKIMVLPLVIFSSLPPAVIQRSPAATIIKTILGLTGVIFMIMIVTAGDLWMTAGGNEEKISKARTMIFNAAVGILIVFGAYIVTDFIVGIVIEGIGGG